jgi:hypothetical protein
MSFESTSHKAVYEYSNLSIYTTVNKTYPTASVNLNTSTTDFSSNSLVKKYLNYFSDILAKPWTTETIVKKVSIISSATIKNADFTIRFVTTPQNEVIGVACFVNGKLLDLDKVPGAPVIDGDTINNISLAEFTINS